MITFTDAVNTLVGLHYFAEKFQKIIQPYTIKIEKENVIIYKNSIEKIKEELKTAINNYEKANKTHNKFIIKHPRKLGILMPRWIGYGIYYFGSLINWFLT